MKEMLDDIYFIIGDTMYNGKVLILDISFYQDDNNTPQKVDFVKMKSNGADGVILRAGQNTWLDPDFKDYIIGAKAAGLPYGIYWYWDSRSSPESQANLLLSNLSEYPPLGIWGDYEEKYGGVYGGFTNFKKFMSLVETAFIGKMVGIYTGYYYWLEHTTTSDREYTKSKNYPLWIAYYYVESPLVPYPWNSYMFWQFTNSGDGLYFGVESREVDMSYFYGNLQEFYNYFNLDGSLPPTGGIMKKGILTPTTASLRIRSGASTAFSQIGGIYQGDTVYGELDTTSGWLHIQWIDRADGTKETIDGWCSGNSLYITLTDYVPPSTGTKTVTITVEIEGYKPVEATVIAEPL